MVFPDMVRIKCEAAGRRRMVLTVVRSCAIGDIGVIVSITWRLSAHCGIRREGIGGHRPSIAARLENHPIPQSQWLSWYPDRKRNIWAARRSRGNANSSPRPHWMWGVCLWSQGRIARWCWIRAPRPTRFVFVGLGAKIDFAQRGFDVSFVGAFPLRGWAPR